MTSEHGNGDSEILALAQKLRYDLTAMQAKLSELIVLAAKLEPLNPAELECAYCRLRFRSIVKLAEHLYTSHDGPLPDHWATADEHAQMSQP